MWCDMSLEDVLLISITDSCLLHGALTCSRGESRVMRIDSVG